MSLVCIVFLELFRALWQSPVPMKALEATLKCQELWRRGCRLLEHVGPRDAL